MFELANIFLQRWFIISLSAPVIAILLLAPMVAHNAGLAADIKALYDNQGVQTTYDTSNVVADGFSRMGASASRAVKTAKLRTLSGIVQLSDGVNSFDKAISDGARAATVFTLHGIGSSVAFTAHAITGSFSFVRHKTSMLFGLTGRLTHLRVSSLIRPTDNSPTPTITQMRAQQASIIQAGTISTAPPVISTGTGGACDSGEGNGNYPMSWCNAPMDSLPTIFFSGDHINRECTSYAYWYFTNVEGHSDFHVTGNAKYWARTSNYPAHAAPALGAIAVETGGAYGHVAIVQALAGQTYAGHVVPAGYIAVSEMNYDWQGHFRYSYSPVSKFSAYLYT